MSARHHQRRGQTRAHEPHNTAPLVHEPASAQTRAPMELLSAVSDPHVVGLSSLKTTAPGRTSVSDVPVTAPGARDAQAWAAIAKSSEEVTRATFVRSFVYAWHGLVHALRTQRNARVHVVLALLAIGVGLWLRISPVEFAMVFVAITGVFIAEMFNTVAEACVDLVTDQYHPLAKIAKDVAAGAVLLNAMLSVVIGLLVFVPHLWPMLLHWLRR